ncbi:unnamed protein product [Thelazia callipaeda]|uniref:CASP-like protein n=1 Tax=Thelazia callipaeda TaxID=103827 RepID=A0A0N5D938_THECL|nr:unnamed protein product [Thelazia callipaeda]
MIFVPKLILLLEIFFSKVSVWRIAYTDGCIAILVIMYAAITGLHAQLLLRQISAVFVGAGSDVVCYFVRGIQEEAPQEFRDKCLLLTLKMFGEHLSLLAVIATFVALISLSNIYYAFITIRK